MDGNQLLLLLGKICKKAIEDGKNETKAESPPKAIDLKVINEIVNAKDEYRIDHQQEQPQG